MVLKQVPWYSLLCQTASLTSVVYRKIVRTGASRQIVLSLWRCPLPQKPVVCYTMPLNGASVGRLRRLRTSRVSTLRRRFSHSRKMHLSAAAGRLITMSTKPHGSRLARLYISYYGSQSHGYRSALYTCAVEHRSPHFYWENYIFHKFYGR